MEWKGSKNVSDNLFNALTMRTVNPKGKNIIYSLWLLFFVYPHTHVVFLWCYSFFS
jgi:hypothetical protein